mmetsp:Transcript_22391/g.40672  ORF Transcript_22391/g.40672 Transcript_22391/m.40672 type:complete len:280 (-) Transcript_22391:571-1410(-)
MFNAFLSTRRPSSRFLLRSHFHAAFPPFSASAAFSSALFSRCCSIREGPLACLCISMIASTSACTFGSMGAAGSITPGFFFLFSKVRLLITFLPVLIPWSKSCSPGSNIHCSRSPSAGAISAPVNSANSLARLSAIALTTSGGRLGPFCTRFMAFSLPIGAGPSSSSSSLSSSYPCGGIIGPLMTRLGAVSATLVLQASRILIRFAVARLTFASGNPYPITGSSTSSSSSLTLSLSISDFSNPAALNRFSIESRRFSSGIPSIEILSPFKIMSHKVANS